MNEIKIKRLKPLLEFEVIDVNGCIMKIKAMSHEANGNYITFFQAIEITKNVDGSEDKSIRKIPFLTLKDINKVSLINLEDEYDLIIENNKEHNSKQLILSSTGANDNINDRIPHKKIHKFNSTIKNDILSKENNNKIESNLENKDINNNNNDSVIIYNEIEDNNNSNSEKESDNNDGNLEDLMYSYMNNSDNNENDNNGDNENDDYLALIEENMNDNNSETPSEVGEIDEMGGFDLSNLDDFNNNSTETQDISNVTSDFLNKEYGSLSSDEFDKKSEENFKKSVQTILNKVDNIPENEDYPSSASEKSFNSVKFNVIKTSLNEYLNRVQNFRIIPFTKYINERESYLGINEDDVISQICSMIKNKEINYQRFWDNNIQDIISKNKDIIEIYYDGVDSIGNVLKLLTQRNNDTRQITMIDLVVYLRKNNFYK